MIKKLTAVAVAIAGLTGCLGGKDLCDRAKANADECDYSYSDDDLKACKDSLKVCSKDEKKALNEYWDCLEAAGLFECPSTETDVEVDEDAFVTCAIGVAGVTPECIMAGAGGSAGTDTTVDSF